jgi:hypothetical protein
VDGAELRAVVREVIAELLPSLMSGPAAPLPTGGQARVGQAPVGQPLVGQLPVGHAALSPSPVGAAGGVSQPASRSAPAQAGLAYTVREHTESVETVSLRTDADLAAFVLRLLHLFENPKQRDALRSGRLRFRLAAPAGPGSVQPSHRIEKGAVTEAMVISAAKSGARLVLGRRAVLTPLARDRARAAGVEIERER